MKKILALALIAMFFGSCTYKFIDPVNEVQVNPNDTVSFSTQVLPIFTDNDNCTSCHKPGGSKPSPDFTSANAYNSIINDGLIDNSDAANSKLYTYPDPADASIHNWKKYTQSQADLILLWITQGANNN